MIQNVQETLSVELTIVKMTSRPEAGTAQLIVVWVSIAHKNIIRNILCLNKNNMFYARKCRMYFHFLYLQPRQLHHRQMLVMVFLQRIGPVVRLQTRVT